MTLRKDLDRLAGECQVCAMADKGSLYDHMLFCPSCQEHSQKAEEIERELKSMGELSAEAETHRRNRLGYEVIDILGMSEGERLEAMRDMFDNLGELNERQRRVILRTHTDLLLALPKAEREKMLRTTSTVYASYPKERLAREGRTVRAVTEAYGPIKRSMVRRMYSGILKG
jgi:hypothetical protein